MSPPIREGSGDSIGSIRLGDGTEISEVRTGAGDVLFSGSAIPDTSMFSSPIYQYYAGDAGYNDGDSGVSLPEVLDDNQGDASVANGSPTYQTNYQSTGKDMVVYDESNPDYHSGTLQTNFTDDNSISIFATFYMVSESNRNMMFSSSNKFALGTESTQYAFENNDGSSVRGGTASANVLDTVGVALSSGNDITLFGGGNEIVADTQSYTLDTSIEIGNWSAFNYPHDGGLFDVVVSDASESLSNYQDYHNDRIA